MMTKKQYEKHVKKLGYEVKNITSYEQYKKRYLKGQNIIVKDNIDKNKINKDTNMK